MEYIKSKKNGMSLLEMVVYIGMYTMIMGVILSAIISFYQSNRYTLEQSAQLENARKSLVVMVGEIREATFSDLGGYPVLSFSENSITFFSNIDSDIGIERIRYFLLNGVIKKGTLKATGNPLAYVSANENTETLAEHVRNVENNIPVFTYYDKNGTLITDFSHVLDIASIGINIQVKGDSETMPNGFNLRTRATLRNLKTNL